MRIARLLIVVAAVAMFSSVALADTVDPAIGIKGGGGSTLVGPGGIFSFTFTGTMGTTITEQDFFFINHTGFTAAELDLVAPGPLTYACGVFSTYFGSCNASLQTDGTTLIKYTGGSGIPNDPSPLCPEGPTSCSPSTGNEAADFAMVVTSLHGDLGQLPPTDRFPVAGTLIAAPVPEPASIILLTTGLGAMGLRRLRRKKMAAA
jgi:hypothetical protein